MTKRQMNNLPEKSIDINADMYSGGVICSGTVLIMLIIIYADVFGNQRREFIVSEISNDCFVLTFCDLYSYDSEFKRIGIF